MMEVRRNNYKVAVDELSSNLQSSGIEKKIEHLPYMVAGVWCDDGSLQLEATTQFRKLLSIERSPPIEEVIQSGVVPRFVEFLKREDFPRLQFEACWSLKNIAAGRSENTKVVIDHGAVPIFVELLQSPSYDIRKQAFWALGNVACDSPTGRDLVLGYAAFYPLLSQLNEDRNLAMPRELYRGAPLTPFYEVQPTLPVLADLILSNEEEVLTNVCWDLSYHSDPAEGNIQAVIESGVCPRLVELLLHPSSSVQIHVLRTLGNISLGDLSHTQILINSQALPSLRTLLTNDYETTIQMDACWIITNIAAVNTYTIQEVIEANIISPLVHLLRGAVFDIKKWAAFAISNASCGSHAQIKVLIDEGCIKPLCDLLTCSDPGVVRACLGGLENILTVGEYERTPEGVNVYVKPIADAGGFEKMDNLQRHDSPKVSEKAKEILEVIGS